MMENIGRDLMYAMGVLVAAALVVGASVGAIVMWLVAR